MSFSATDDTKQQIREAVDIVDLVGSAIDLRRQGRSFVGICPWHDDSRPSLQVNPERQSWKCWVCNIGGDIFSFVMQREGVEFREALVMLADRAGIPLATTPRSSSTRPGSADDKQTLYQAMAWSTQQYHDCLMKSPEAEGARKYLENRGIKPESCQRFRLGFAPNHWQWLLDRARTTAYSGQVLEAAGLVGRSARSGQYYDRFKGRVLFPIRDTQGRSVALGGRILPELADDKSAKYINSPETRLFSKSEHLYGLDTVRNSTDRRRHVVIVEGYTDAVMAWQFGMDDVAAVLGTALGSRHIQVLRRFADTITLVLDGDQAGQRRTNEILELFVSNQVDLRIVTLPQDLDPCDFLLARGADEFRRLVSNAVDALEHKIQVTMRDFDPLRDTHRASQALEELLGTLAKAPRLQSGTTSLMRMRQEQILSRLARQFRVDEAELRSRLTTLRRKKTRAVFSDTAVPQEGDLLSRLDSIDRELLELLTQDPQLTAVAHEVIPCEGLSTPEAREIYTRFVELWAADATADFDHVLTEVENPRLKHMLVQLEENARNKAVADPKQQLRDVLDAYRRRQEKQRRRTVLAELEQRNLDEQKEIELLQQFYDQERERQGISAPTDG